MSQMRHRPLTRNTFYRDSPVAAYALYGTGPLHGLANGARYSPPGKFPVLYFAADRLQAQLEVAHHINRHLPPDPHNEIRQLHSALSSYNVELLREILQNMSDSETGYVESQELSTFLEIPIVDQLFRTDPARLQLYLEFAPHLRTPLRCVVDASRVTLSVNITARGILDLTHKETLDNLGIDSDELLLPTRTWVCAEETNYPLTQRIGLAAWDAAGVDGILAPSALSKDSTSSLVRRPANLILFMHENEPSRPRSNAVKIETEEEFVKMTKLFWVHRPEWLIKALETYEPECARIFKRLPRT
ncbi:MAG TPA: RES domain-containing protein [Chroococcales cyanobacterium]